MQLDTPYVFKHLVAKNCPDCKAGVKSCSINGQHTNGDQFEKVTFDCGATLEYSPNFSRIQIVTPCPKNANSKKLELNRIRLLSGMARVIEALDLTEDSKAELQKNLERDINYQWSYLKAHSDLVQTS